MPEQSYTARLRATAAALRTLWYPESAVSADECEAIADALEAAKKTLDAWSESWDCSRDPGHRLMEGPIAEQSEALAALDRVAGRG